MPSPCHLPSFGIESPVEPCPDTIKTPAPKIPPYRSPRWKILRQQTPLAAGSQKIEDGVGDLTKISRPRPAAALGCRHVRLNQSPLFVRKITRISRRHYHALLVIWLFEGDHDSENDHRWNFSHILSKRGYPRHRQGSGRNDNRARRHG